MSAQTFSRLHHELLDGSGANIIGGSAIKEDYQVYVKQSCKAQSRSLYLFKLPY